MEHAVYHHFFVAEDRHWWFRARRRIVAATLAQLLGEGGHTSIADVGCGTGGMLELLAGFGNVVGVDESPQAREYCSRRGYEQVLTLDRWEERRDLYDLVTAFDVTEHVEDDVGFLRQLGSHVRPGGHLVITVPAYQALWSAFDRMNHHQRRYSRRHLRRSLEAAGLEVVKLSHFNTVLFPLVVVDRVLEKLFRREPVTDEDNDAALGRWFKVGPLNPVLEALFGLERHWLPRHSFPFGCSILAIARHP